METYGLHEDHWFQVYGKIKVVHDITSTFRVYEEVLWQQIQGRAKRSLFVVSFSKFAGQFLGLRFQWWVVTYQLFDLVLKRFEMPVYGGLDNGL